MINKIHLPPDYLYAYDSLGNSPVAVKDNRQELRNLAGG